MCYIQEQVKRLLQEKTVSAVVGITQSAAAARGVARYQQRGLLVKHFRALTNHLKQEPEIVIKQNTKYLVIKL